ncbi:DUF6468 domain-containing protein [Roseomonas elaeocarpi]|uniref:DUF6468 domain-containing protein n=1 Tax=Roseomonas elaeocarpi TaxID=907779 RepID=A0ABV6JP66_9PROT
MTGIEWLLQAVLLLLLAVAIPFGWRLERQLGALRRDRPALENGAADFAEATRQAEAALIRLRATAESAGRNVGEKLAQAEPIRDDLRFLVERAEALADRLEVLVRSARPAGTVPGAAHGGVMPGGVDLLPSRAAEPPPAAEAPRSQAERDLLRALRLAR